MNIKVEPPESGPDIPTIVKTSQIRNRSRNTVIHRRARREHRDDKEFELVRLQGGTHMINFNVRVFKNGIRRLVLGLMEEVNQTIKLSPDLI